MRRLAQVLLVTGLCLSSFSASHASDRSYDAGVYLDTVQKLKDQPVESQVEGWRKFLDQHPDTRFREEIESNLKNLENLMVNTDPKQKKEKRDAEKYLRAVEYSKKLSPEDQVALWEQFLEENPESIYRTEANKNLNELKARSETPRAPAKPGAESSALAPAVIGVVPDVQFKDKQKATLLATFPGLIVPGIGHWYTQDYTLAGVMTGMRVVGVSMGIPGIINDDTALIVIGSILAGFSYVLDVVDAPFSVERTNEELEQKKAIKSELPSRGRDYMVSLSFSF